MNKNKITINLEQFSLCEDVFFPKKTNIDYEYLLRYLEIFKDELKSRFSLNFSSNWESKLFISFTLMYQYYEKTLDIRVLNMLFKNRMIIKRLNIPYGKNTMYKLIIFNFKKIKNES